MNSFNTLNNDYNKLKTIEKIDKFTISQSNYFLQKLFYYLLKKKSLKIIKYNKNIQRRININVNDYKRYS